MRFDEWLRTQRAYQAETYGVDYDAMRQDAEKRTAYITTQLYALIHEVVEAGQETPWKPWATVDKDAFWQQSRKAFVGEMVDVLFFVGNALAAVDCTDEELASRYGQKMDVNKQRQVAGYDGTNKCTECGRAFDDTHVADGIMIQWDTGQRFCSATCEDRHSDNLENTR